MSQRTLLTSALAALAVLLVIISAAFLLTSEAGVDTNVQSAIATATPLPDPLAANWLELEPGSGQYQYIGNTQNTVILSVQYTTLDEFIFTNEFTPVAEDTATPLLDLLTELHTEIGIAAAEQGLVIDEEAIIGPQTETFGGVPMSLLRLYLPPQLSTTGQQFPGAELVYAWMLDGAQFARAEVQYQGTTEPMIYLDFRAWLEENAASMLEQVQANAAEAAEAEAAAEAAGDDEDAGAADDEGADDAADPDADVAPAATGPWLPLDENVYQHATQPNAIISVDPFSLEELAAGVGFVPEEGTAITPVSIMEHQVTNIQAQL
ncbi:MAG: hypothetical protein K8S97_01440, partial [Anaerolineae bacterium]|nr:hypothetical protein [Anaerolineae bacterium]